MRRAVDAAPWLAARPWLFTGSILALAGAFEFSNLKRHCLSKCCHPAPYLLAHYRRGTAAGFRLGFGHGNFCLGCCWALMLLMFAAGVAALWWMAALTLLMVYEKVGHHGVRAARVAGLALLAAAVFQLVHPAWLPAVLSGPSSFAARTAIGPGPVTHILGTGRYRLELHLTPNRATGTGTLLLKLRNGDHAVNGARIHAGFTMLAMDMGQISTRLRQTGPGTYAARIPALRMPGRWRLRLEIAPTRAASFTLHLVDEVAP